MTGTEIVGLAGIFGTLVSGAIAWWATWKIQERRITHENQTRFHDDKLDMYSKYVDALNRARTEYRINGILSDDTFGLMTDVMARASLLSPTPVINILSEVNDILFEIHEGERADHNVATLEHLTSLHSRIILQMREDLNMPYVLEN